MNIHLDCWGKVSQIFEAGDILVRICGTQRMSCVLPVTTAICLVQRNMDLQMFEEWNVRSEGSGP